MLINCSVYEDGIKLADIQPEEIGDYLSLPSCFVWIALLDASSDEIDSIENEFKLHPLAVKDVKRSHLRPKVDEYDRSLFVVLPLFEVEERNSSTSLTTGELKVLLGQNYIVSIRCDSHHGFAGVRERCEQEPNLLRNGPGFVLYALMDEVVGRYFPIVDALEMELEAIERQIFVSSATKASIQRLYELKQRLTIFRHAISPLLEAMDKLHGRRAPAACAGLLNYFRDVTDHLARINSSAEDIRDTINSAMQVTLSMVTIEQGEVTKRLAAWASIFAVCTALAGIWGMNFEIMPELKWHYGYPMALMLMVSTCGYLYLKFRRAKWL